MLSRKSSYTFDPKTLLKYKVPKKRYLCAKYGYFVEYAKKRVNN
jgi:hypothetical protein